MWTSAACIQAYWRPQKVTEFLVQEEYSVYREEKLIVSVRIKPNISAWQYIVCNQYDDIVIRNKIFIIYVLAQHS